MPSTTPQRGIRQILYEAAGDIDTKTAGTIVFFVDTLGVFDTVETIRHNCYLRVPATNYAHLLFQVTCQVPGPWPTTVTTPEGEQYTDLQDEPELLKAIGEILARDRTTEIVEYLLSTVS